MTLKILHLADLHLDHPFPGASATSQAGNQRRTGLRLALQSALALAQSRQVDAVTIGGDLFDAATVSPDTAIFLRQQFAQIAPIQVYIAPGAHDPYTSDSVYAYMEWPSNVHIFTEPRLTAVDLPGEVQLWGLAYDSPTLAHTSLADLQVPLPRPSVLLAHGALAGAAAPASLGPLPGTPGAPDGARPQASLTAVRKTADFAPADDAGHASQQAGLTLTLDEVRAAGFELALLGHAHTRLLEPGDAPLLCYPGSPEPLGFDEESGHSVLLAERQDDQWKIESVDLSRWLCRTWELDTSDYSAQEQVAAKVRGLIAAEGEGKQIVARVILRGQPAPGFTYDLAGMNAMLAADYPYVHIDDRTVLSFDLDTLETELTIRGSFVRRMRAQLETSRASQDSAMQALVHRALSHGLRALEGRKVTL